MTGTPAVPPASGTDGESSFLVRLDNFEGPFDLLLQLIWRHKLDITEVALSRVTDEFIAHVVAGGSVWDLEQTSSFLVVAATLLDLKAARLLPSGEVEDAEDLAVLEARDLLFARLLQYRAFKLASGWLGDVLADQARRHPRPGGLEPQFVGLLPQVRIGVGATRLAAIAARLLASTRAQQVSLEHLHTTTVSVREQSDLIVARLRSARTLTFRDLCAGADTLTTVARFLALLELFRQQQVSFDQLTPLGELTIRWTGSVAGEIEISDEFDVAEAADHPSPGQEQTP